MKKSCLIIVLACLLLSLVLPAAVFAEEIGSEAEAALVPDTAPEEELTEETLTPSPASAPARSGKTGVVKNRYYKNGKFTKATGIVKRLSDRKWVYVRNGVFKKSTGAAKRLSDGKWLYVKNGVFNKKTGLVKKISSKTWTYVKKGVQPADPKQIRLTKEDKKAKREGTLISVYAKAVYNQVTSENMSKKQKLMACFKYVAGSYQYIMKRIPYYTKHDWPYVYTLDMIQDKGSACFGYAGLFGYLAKKCGYKHAYWCTNGHHAWVEIEGRVYDPLYLYGAKKACVFNLSYKKTRSLKLGPDYNNSAYPQNKWMRIKIS